LIGLRANPEKNRKMPKSPLEIEARAARNAKAPDTRRKAIIGIARKRVGYGELPDYARSRG
jgi:hypothetical protein